MIEFVDVRRQYGQKTAVAGLNLTVGAGELFAFLGPNGAGKTTTIKMLVGLLRPTAGQIRVCGFDVGTAARDARRLLSYVPDEPYLYDKLSGREFLRFIVDMYGLDPKLGGERIEREIAAFELTDFVDDLTESYSHGMKQRLVFASAMLHDPAVLVIDEPMVGLDPRSARILKDLLRAKSRSGHDDFPLHAHAGTGRRNRRSDRHPRSRQVDVPGNGDRTRTGIATARQFARAAVPAID